MIPLNENYHVCPGCSLLCDDIEIKVEDNRITQVNTACIKGVSRIKKDSDSICRVDGKEESVDKAINRAAHILKNSTNPLIFGLGNSTNEAQIKAIEMAKKTGAILDDTSSFCQGPILKAIFEDRIKTCTLDDVRNHADVIVYWGADPANSHPRHNSKFAYYPRGKERQRGWDVDRKAIAVDVRMSHTAILCGDNFYAVPAGKDEELIEAIISAIAGKVPKVSFDMDTKRILQLANALKKAKFGVIFAGLGLVYSLNDIEPIIKLISKLNETSNFHLLPMVGHYNMRGFNENLFTETGYINRVKFEINENMNDVIVRHGPEYSVIEQLRNKKVDSAMIIGSDPLISMPGFVAEHLKNIPLIVIDPCETLTTKIADVVIPSAISSIECSGSAIRMDGENVQFNPAVSGNSLCDEQIIERIMEEL
ncbi:formylmethanofuran dehydrogenase subunit B [Methanosalsum zhilinae DSM 4017]|uniref:Formylmethanofuran dehydrogenase subunit B n=1 Tax=Methanosalsum zhilinae (strain DSM 4017 / NBRC 107636 / OCM 62 / WeN5) TaxID=679901 RepID=F7XK53_METZD|nr:formylmethanofuran dehydrogenase subunit B [Methanosalsum zhilinae DSM 4017]